MKEKERLQQMWELYVKEGTLHSDLDPVIKNSWIRSKKNNVDPFQTTGTEKLSTRRLEQRLQERSKLIAISLPLMEALYSLVRGSGFLVVLCDEKGYLLKVIGDPEPLANAEKIQFVRGANWSEAAIGTNAIGTAIFERRPIQIFSYQHYAIATQSWTCSASPILDAAGKMIGVLNISGPYEKVHPHTLGMIVSTVKAIEYELQLKEKTEKNEQMMSYLEETTNTLNDGIIVLNEKGQIIKTNRILQQILQIQANDMEGENITKILASPEIAVFLATNQEIADAEVKLTVHKTGKPISVLLNAKPITRGNQLIGALLTIKEIKRVRQLVNHLSGNQAKVTFHEIIGKNEKFLSCIQEAKLAAQTDATVLLMGASGTGKDLFAQAIHNESSRREGPFIAINCGGIPRDLLGSELFGYVEGAFTGARKGGNAGKFELADGGTLFLDEIGEMSLEMQVLLLRVLQNREVARIGGSKVVPVNVRIIAATNKDLKKEVQQGNFREDLYFRLNVMPIQIPSLRERSDDIPLLVAYFSGQIAASLQKPKPKILNEVITVLKSYPWPGNVRELNNLIERAIVRSANNELSAALFPPDISESKQPFSEDTFLLSKKDERKRQDLLESIKKFNGNFSKAAAYLGVSRSTLYRQMKRYNIR
ncbi:sigma-54-dependent Fis family transcriptional regulator [Neobacillus sp. SM06]|uniref:sigma-54-dependent Fis family transcriptional regulator n=1 Tax=Neobacillus sp. SM06 TaxID=3422492 RepID=UPI003D2C003E